MTEQTSTTGTTAGLSYGDGTRRKASPGGSVPEDRTVRESLRAAAEACVATHRLAPPLSMPELEDYADEIGASAGQDGRYHNFAMVLLYNAVWRDSIAAMPFDRRILLLPPCLRDSRECKAEFDALGLICRKCGNCVIGALSQEAEALGYAVLVAEGTSTVTTLIESGQIDGAVGVSCMAALERAFPHMANAAIPSLAVPLVHDGCSDTDVDVEWVREALHLQRQAPAMASVDLDKIHKEVSAWFDLDTLREELASEGTETEEIGLAWLAGHGKRWRPFLTAAVYRAAAGGDGSLPTAVKQVGIAVECIHKASLVYDDIQDRDKVRYGESTLHEQYGVPVALTAGLYLLGHGYRLLADCAAETAVRADMLSLATQGHCRLCLGQGAELLWTRNPGPLTVDQVLDILSRKTAPSFVVVFRLGAILAGCDAPVHDALDAYGTALGVAYQIQDDLQDFTEGGDVDDIAAGRPSLALALTYEGADAAGRELLEAAWRESASGDRAREIRRLARELGVEDAARAILASYRDRALAALRPVRDAGLKTLLHRVAAKILKPQMTE